MTFPERFANSVFDFRPTGTSADHVAIHGFIAAIEARPDRTGTINIIDNGKEPVLDPAAVGGATFKSYYANIHWRAERPNGTRFINDSNFSFIPGGWHKIHDGDLGPTAAGIFAGTWAGAANPGAATLTSVSMPGYTLVKGDHVYITADNPLATEPHNTGGQQRPGECRQVTRVVGSTVELNKPLNSVYTTNPQVFRYRAWTGSWDGIIPHCTTTRTDSVQRPFIQACRVKDYRVYNSFAEKASGYWNFHLHQDTKVAGVTMLDVPNQFNDYGLLFGAGDSFSVQHCHFEKVRHGVTTGGIEIGLNVYGNTDGVVQDCTGKIINDGVNAYVMFDTHPSGGVVTYRRCHVTSCGNLNKVHYAFSGRSAGMIIEDCSAEGSDQYNLSGVRPMGPGYEVIRFRGRKLYRGVIFGPGNHNEYHNGLTVDDIDLKDVQSTGILIWNQVNGAGAVNNVRINGGEFVNVAFQPGSINVEADPQAAPNNKSLKRAAITIFAGSGHRIRGANLPLINGGTGSYLYAIDATALAPAALSVRQCDLSGYGSGELGITADSTGSVAFNSAYAAHNSHD